MMKFQFSATHVTIIAVAFIAGLTTLVVVGKLDASVFVTPAVAFFAWLSPSPMKQGASQ